MRLAMAYSTSVPKGATITTSRDTSRVARALKRALIAGINLSGVNVEDIELATVPLTRFQVRNSRSQGGITVRLAPGDPDSVEIRFFEADGRDIDPGGQRKIERLLYREDYRRAFGGEVGDIVFPPRSLEFYTAGLERMVDIEQVRRKSFKIVLDYSFGASSIVMPSLLARLNAEVLAVNPFASTESATSTAEVREAQTARLADLVRVSGSNLGFVIDPEGEFATVVDDTGHILAPDELLLSLVTLVKAANPDASVAVPVNATDAVERILGSPDKVARTRLWGANLMETAVDLGVVFAGTPDGGCAWPEFLPAYDAAVTLVKLLDLLAAVDRPLSRIVAELPERHVIHETIVTPWERKGAVMREIVERAGTRETQLIDGVKVIEPGQWALVLPDPDEALTHVWAEAGTAVDARRGRARVRRADPPGAPVGSSSGSVLPWRNFPRVCGTARSTSGSRSRARAPGSGSPTSPRTRSVTSSTSSCPRWGPT